MKQESFCKWITSGIKSFRPTAAQVCLVAAVILFFYILLWGA